MKTASENKPAAEGSEEHLLAKSREEVLAARVNQKFGHMVRQIVERRDWMLDQIDVKVHSVRFRKAACYRRRNWFNLHVFRSSSDSRDFLVTARRQDPTLPAGSLWIFYATIASLLKAAVALSVNDIIQLLQQADSQGYQRIRTERMLRGT